MMTPKSHDSSDAVRRLLMRWAVLLVALIVLATWATCRVNRAASRLEEVAATGGGGGEAEAEVAYWTCTMHPDVRADAPGDCPRCGMTLVPKYVGSDEPGVKPVAAVNRPAAAGKQLYKCTMPECNDQGSEDPKSRCPMCGMVRESVGQASTSDDVGPAETMLSDRARRLAEVATEPATNRLLSKRIRTVGKVTYDETNHKMVAAWIDGRIEKLYADYTGMVVQKGEHLVEFYSPGLIDAQAGLLSALRGYEKIKDSSLPEARERARRVVVSAERQLELLGITPEQIEQIKRTGQEATTITVYAPLGGTIVRKTAMEGMYVKTGDVLYEIAALSHVWLILDLYESDLPWIRPMQDVHITAEAMPGKSFEGQIAFVDPVVDEMTRTIRVRVNVENPEQRLKPGMFVRAEIVVALGEDAVAASPDPGGAFACPMHPWKRADQLSTCGICEMDMVAADTIPGWSGPHAAGKVLSVPREAVLRTGSRSLIYVEARPGTYRGVDVVVGPLASAEAGREFYPILAGIREGAAVVTRGNFAIDSQMQLAGKPSLFNAQANEDGEGVGGADDSVQRLCPVMGNPVVSDVFTDYLGIRIYFCCPPCIKKFTDEPDKWIPKLPAALQQRIATAREQMEGHQHD
jgi:Cu(I)/Ag(I) efflux system membrane fusion protein